MTTHAHDSDSALLAGLRALSSERSVPADGWERLSARLPPREPPSAPAADGNVVALPMRPRRRWWLPVGAALAASLAVYAVAPWRHAQPDMPAPSALQLQAAAMTEQRPMPPSPAWQPEETAMTRTLISCCVALLLAPSLALADTRIDERHTLAAGGRIELSNVAGKVTVRGWDRNDVQLTGTLSDGLQLRQEKSANRVRWEIEYPRRNGNGGATLVLNVPRSVELLLSTVSASQDISGIDVRRLQADTVSGSLSAAGRSGDSKLNTVSGSWPDRGRWRCIR
ncbi:hypothetical protein G6F35_010947 [Rhizopus arrhizus]|nr:hypothetical protein G6F35_010947 [Rhizopus arrhizus]